MNFSLENRTVTLSVGEFAGFSLGPQEGSGGPSGLWRAQLGQHWHNELQKRTQDEFTTDGTLRPDVKFEVVISGKLTHRGWTFELNGRIDQQVGGLLREIKSVMHPLPADEPTLRADYPAYFLQLGAYVVLLRTQGAKDLRAELVFVEASSGLAQTVLLTPFDEALVFVLLELVERGLTEEVVEVENLFRLWVLDGLQLGKIMRDPVRQESMTLDQVGEQHFGECCLPDSWNTGDDAEMRLFENCLGTFQARIRHVPAESLADALKVPIGLREDAGVKHTFEHRCAR